MTKKTSNPRLDHTKYFIVQTCNAAPEQYDVLVHDEEIGETVKIGYLRLRHGIFTAEVPEVFGSLVYQAKTYGHSSFEYEEREPQITEALKQISYHYQKELDGDRAKLEVE